MGDEQRQISEVRDLAHSAAHVANKALTAISGHEDICAERYDNIKDFMREIRSSVSNMKNEFSTSQTSMQASITSLSTTKSEIMGGITVIKYSGLALVLLALISAVTMGVKTYVASIPMTIITRENNVQR